MLNLIRKFLRPTLREQLEAGVREGALCVTSRSETPQLWEQAISQFEKQNPGVKIAREIAPNSSTQFHDLVAQKLRNRDTSLDDAVRALRRVAASELSLDAPIDRGDTHAAIRWIDPATDPSLSSMD